MNEEKRERLRVPDPQSLNAELQASMEKLMLPVP